MLRQFGFYAFLLSLAGVLGFTLLLFGHDRSAYFIILDIDIVAVIVALMGLIFDRRKKLSMIALLLSLAPHLVLFCLQK